MNIGRFFFERFRQGMSLAIAALAAACTTPGYVIQQPAASSTVPCTPPTGTGPAW